MYKPIRQVKVIIRGNVQGVFFRYHLLQLSLQYSIKGYVKNKQDGTVEAVFQGHQEDILSMINFCKKGPDQAKVDDIEVFEQAITNTFKDFRVAK